MLSSIQKTIIIQAVSIRLRKGEELAAILDSYPRLTVDEREEIVGEMENR